MIDAYPIISGIAYALGALVLLVAGIMGIWGPK